MKETKQTNQTPKEENKKKEEIKAKEKKTKTRDVNVRFRKRNTFFNTIQENVGEYTYDTDLLKEEEDIYIPVKLERGITEKQFYQSFLSIRNALARYTYENDDSKLSEVTIEYLSAIMSKPLDYTMPCNAKNNVQINLAKELGRSAKSVYSAINRLKKGGYLVVSEDNLIVLNNELQNLRKVTKKHLELLGTFPVSYSVNFIVE